MSALGHKQTYAVQYGMSALPPKADMCSANTDVRFGPKADIVAPCHILARPRFVAREIVGRAVVSCAAARYGYMEIGLFPLPFSSSRTFSARSLASF